MTKKCFWYLALDKESRHGCSSQLALQFERRLTASQPQHSPGEQVGANRHVIWPCLTHVMRHACHMLGKTSTCAAGMQLEMPMHRMKDISTTLESGCLMSHNWHIPDCKVLNEIRV